MDSAKPISLEKFLRSKDPCIDWRAHGAGSTIVKNPKKPVDIRKWSEFDIDTLMSMSDGMLKDALRQEYDFRKCERDADHTHFQSRRYRAPVCEKALDLVLARTVQDTVSCALQKSQQYLQYRHQLLTAIDIQGLSMSYGCEARKLTHEILDPSTGRLKLTEIEPDWAGVCLDNPDLNKPWKEHAPFLPTTILPGDSKLRGKLDWNTLKNLRPEDLSGKKALAPEVLALYQIYTYCYRANCRYGYVISETQLLVVRIKPMHEARAKYGNLMKALEVGGLLEYRLISYENSDPGNRRLCVNLALWWLHILAAFDGKLHWYYEPLASVKLTNHMGPTMRQPTPEEDDEPASQPTERPASELRRKPSRQENILENERVAHETKRREKSREAMKRKSQTRGMSGDRPVPDRKHERELELARDRERERPRSTGRNRDEDIGQRQIDDRYLSSDVRESDRDRYKNSRRDRV